ncbi:DUF805 domain-containing protein [Ferrovibrio sp. MS7]|uniref:DUF805 domain-containing protein n=1 Tax=Ferrovibrio plantarum TaxID=3119164 RepID=UPI0031365F46
MSKPVFSDLLTFSVRRNRKSYALAQLYIALPLFILICGIALVVKTNLQTIALLPLFILLLFICVVLTVQRLNDIGWSGWLGLGLLLLPIGFFLELALLLIPGEVGPNKYGPDPLEPPESPAA